MDEQSKSHKSFIRFERIFGIILLIPPLIGVILFLICLISEDAGRIPALKNLSDNWSGGYNYAANSGGGGFTSATPIYLGLMAIAGAYLLKGSDKVKSQIDD